MMKFTVWKAFPVDSQAEVWNISCALFTALLLLVIGITFQTAEVWLVVALAVGFELQTSFCSAAYMLRPWSISPGDAVCSSKFHFPVCLVGAWLATVVLMCMRKKGISRGKSES